ncbi:hypothetical protein H4R21_001961 [Coemansia helicoidea]|uniref:Uncharacterized protein n=1 Tax=Coemansia helicoidea TaxID=1286919 RepID=A0ACC1LAE0_9FUNG|nr:hypothetical protein H4R21_001961 [Coemansia helicoidea]
MAGGDIDICTVLATVPESIDAEGLARLALEAGLADAAACVARAAAIDRQTGRTDWAAAWLAAVAAEIGGLAQAAANARAVDRLVRGGGDYALADVVELAPDALVGWLVESAGSLNALDVAADAGLAAAWNAWWRVHLVDAPAARACALIRIHPTWFATDVLLAAVLAVGAPCSDAHSAAAALDAIVANGRSEQTTVVLPPQLAAAVQRAPAASELCGVLRDLADQDIAAVVAAGRQLAQAAWRLGQLGVAVDVPALAGVQGSAAAQRRLLARATGAARQQRRLAAVEVAAALAELSRVGLFAALDADAACGAWLQALLRDGQLDGARQLLDSDTEFAASDAARDAVCGATRELFDNAGSCGEAAQAARRCVEVAPQHHSHDAVRRELLLIEAAQLVASLGAAGGVLPLEIRLAADPYDLARLVLARVPGSHRKQRIVRQLAAAARRIADPASPPDASLRDLAVESPADALVLALMLEAANAAGDSEAAHRIVRQLSAARPVLRRALAAASESEDDWPLEARAVDSVWRACAAFGAAAHAAPEERQAALALALSMCPPAEIPALLAQWHPALRPAPGTMLDPAARVRDALLGVAPEPVGAVAATASGAATALEPGAIHTFDPAVIRRCLQAHRPEARGTMLVEWLVFAQTAARGPTTAEAQTFRERLEADIVERHGAAAGHALASRVLPQLAPADHARLAEFYTLYARCLADPAAKQQATARARLAQHVAGAAELRGAAFGALVALATGDVDAACAELVTFDARIDALTAVAPALADLRVLATVDGAESSPERGAAQITSALYAWQLRRVLGRADGAELFGDLLAAWVPRLERSDLADLAARVAFEPQAALSPAARCEAVDLCAALAGDAPAVERARAFAAFAAALDAQRDPFSFAALPRAWVARLIDGVAADTDAAALVQRLRTVLDGMVATAEPAYFVCETYACAAQLAAVWGAPLPALVDVYVEALGRAVVADGGDADAVLAACESALELCTFSYGASALGDVLVAFRRDLGAVLAQTAREGRLPAGPAVDSAVRLELLRLHGEYCADNAAPEAAGLGDMRLHLLADEHWGVNVPPGADQLSVWRDLLRATSVDRAHEQAPLLATMLVDWDAAPGTADRWAELLAWAVRNGCSQSVPQLAAQLPAQHAAAVGPLVFEPLLETAPASPQSVCALALLALLFPDPVWADACVGQAVHVMLSAPAAGHPPPAEEADDAWGIDDVPLDDGGSAEPSPEALIAARDAVMDCDCLHLAIARGGYVAACAASMPLLDRVGRTLLRAAASTASRPLADECRVVADAVPGGALELLRRSTATLCEIGLEHIALQWLYALFVVPPTCRFAATRPAALRWQRHLDTLVCGPAGPDAAVPGPPSPPQPPAVDEEPNGWDDDGFDLDSDVAKLSPPSPDPTKLSPPPPDTAGSWGDDGFDLDLGADAVQLSQSPPPPDAADGWGDDDDIDLDADLEDL